MLFAYIENCSVPLSLGTKWKNEVSLTTYPGEFDMVNLGVDNVVSRKHLIYFVTLFFLYLIFTC